MGILVNFEKCHPSKCQTFGRGAKKSSHKSSRPDGSVDQEYFFLIWSKWDHRFGPKSVRPTEREIFFVESI